MTEAGIALRPAVLLGLMISKLLSEYQDLLIVEDTIFTGQDYYQLNAQLADLEISLLEETTNNNLSKDSSAFIT